MDNISTGENVTKESGFQVVPSLRPTRERVGLNVDGANAAAAVKTIAAAEAAGVRQIWMNQVPWSPDILKAFELAGQIADGALSWVCPVPYLLRTGIPALRASAAAVGRSAAPPPLVTHISVALSEDRGSVLAAGHRLLDFYAKFPFYAKMF